VHERTLQTTDGRATAYSERERKFTFAKNSFIVILITKCLVKLTIYPAVPQTRHYTTLWNQKSPCSTYWVKWTAIQNSKLSHSIQYTFIRWRQHCLVHWRKVIEWSHRKTRSITDSTPCSRQQEDVATERLYKTCISRYDNCAPYTRIQSIDAVSAHSNALCEADNRSVRRWDRRWCCSSWTSRREHPATSHTVWRPCRAVWGVPHPATWIASGTCALRPLQILRIVFKRGSPHSTWLSTVPHADRCDSAFVLIFNSVGTVTDLRTFNSYF